MRIALVFSGQMRTLDECAASIREHLIEPLSSHQLDVFVHAAADADADKALLLDPRMLVIETQPWFDEKRYAHHVGRFCAGIQSVLKQLWSIKRANDLKRGYEASRGFQYDYTVRVRPDTEFVQGPIELKDLRPGTRGVWIPKFSNWFGLNDRFAFGSNQEMDDLSARIDVLDEYVAKGGVFHPESFHWWAAAHKRIPIHRTNAAFYTLRANGERVLPDFYSEYREVAARPAFAPQPDCLDLAGFPAMKTVGDGRPFPQAR